MAQFDAGVTKV